MISVVRPILTKFSPDKDLLLGFKRIIGQFPKNIDLYKIALSQRSLNAGKSKKMPNNERLEYLGDAVISSIVAEYLYKIFPNKQEGFLTQMRAKIISRRSLNALSRKSGLADLIKHPSTSNFESKNAPGNVFEAIHGAMLLDLGYEKTKKIFIKKFLKYIDLDKLEEIDIDYKSKLHEWAQKSKRQLEFKCYEEEKNQFLKHFHVILFDNDKQLAEGYGSSKKEASQIAARQAFLSGSLG